MQSITKSMLLILHGLSLLTFLTLLSCGKDESATPTTSATTTESSESQSSSSSSSESSVDKSKILRVGLLADLPDCTIAIDGVTYYVSFEYEFYYCDINMWVVATLVPDIIRIDELYGYSTYVDDLCDYYPMTTCEVTNGQVVTHKDGTVEVSLTSVFEYFSNITGEMDTDLHTAHFFLSPEEESYCALLNIRGEDTEGELQEVYLCAYRGSEDITYKLRMSSDGGTTFITGFDIDLYTSLEYVYY